MRSRDGGKQPVRIARVYDDRAPAEGTRVLVDRLWPRGLRKDKAAIDVWLKEVAPSTELRHWYQHDPAKRAEFEARYRSELGDPAHAEALTELKSLVRQGPVTLTTATKELSLSNAAVLAEVLS